MYYESVQNRSFQFSLTFLRTLSALFRIQVKIFRKTHEVIILLYAYCYQSLRKLADMAWCSLISKLRLPYQSFCMLACSQLPKFVKTNPKKPETTVYLSSFTNFFCGISQSWRLCCCAFKPVFVGWVTLWRKNTAYWSCWSAILCFCRFSTRNNY